MLWYKTSLHCFATVLRKLRKPFLCGFRWVRVWFFITMPIYFIIIKVKAYTWSLVNKKCTYASFVFQVCMYTIYVHCSFIYFISNLVNTFLSCKGIGFSLKYKVTMSKPLKIIWAFDWVTQYLDNLQYTYCTYR